MTSKKQEHALGKGLDALIRKDYLDEEPVKKSKKQTKEIVKTEDDGESISEDTIKITKGVPIHKDSKLDVDDKVVDAVLLEVHKNPRISLWSAKSAAVLRFLKKTKPEFSISNEASSLIEQAVKDRHPEIWKIFEDKGL